MATTEELSGCWPRHGHFLSLSNDGGHQKGQPTSPWPPKKGCVAVGHLMSPPLCGHCCPQSRGRLPAGVPHNNRHRWGQTTSPRPPQKGHRSRWPHRGSSPSPCVDDERQWGPRGHHGRAVGTSGRITDPPETFALTTGRAQPRPQGSPEKGWSSHRPCHGSSTNPSVGDGHQEGKPCPCGHRRTTTASSPRPGEPLRAPGARLRAPGRAPAW